MNDLHDLSQWSTAALENRMYDVSQWKTTDLWNIVRHECDDFEVDEGKLIRDCKLNDDDAIFAELKRRNDR